MIGPVLPGRFKAYGRAVNRVLASIIALIVVAGSAAACTRHKAPAASATQATARVRAGSVTTLAAVGVTVSLPDGAAADGTTVRLTVTADSASLGPPDGIEVAGPKVTVDLPGGLTKPATVTFPIPAGVADGTLSPVVVWQEAGGAWRWTPTTYAAGDPAVSATVDHFSWGFLGGIDVKRWAKDRWADLRNYLTGRRGVDQPHCGDEAAARAGGVEVTSDGGDRVKWCLGVDGGKRVLRVVNNMRTYVQISYPSGWKVVDGQSVSFSTDTVARVLGMLAVTPKGTASRIVDGGDTLTLAVPDGATGKVTAEMSIVAWDISAVFFGLDVYTLVAKAASNALATAAKGATDRFALLLGATAKAEPLDALKDCTKGISDLTEMSETKAWKVLEFAWKCVPGLMKSQLEDVHVFAAGVLIGMVGAAVGAILTAVHLLVTGARELWDEIASFGGKSDPQYDIQIRVKAACLSATEFAKNAYPFDTGTDRLEKAEVLGSVTCDGGYAATSQVRFTLVGEDGSRSSYVNWLVLKNNKGKWEYYTEGSAPVDAACTDPGSLLLKTPPAIRRAVGCR